MSKHYRAHPEGTLCVLGELPGGTLGLENGPRHRTRTHSQELAPWPLAPVLQPAGYRLVSPVPARSLHDRRTLGWCPEMAVLV